jgi:hypothetical protein
VLNRIYHINPDKCLGHLKGYRIDEVGRDAFIRGKFIIQWSLL